MTRIHIPIRLRWSDLDAYGHLNNSEVLRLLEEARTQVLWSFPDDDGSDEGRGRTAIIDARPPSGATSPVIVRHELEYLAPAPYWYRPLDIQLWFGRIGTSSLEVCTEIWSPIGEEPRVLYVRASTTVVMVDTPSGRPRPITEHERASWEPHLGAPIEFVRR